MRIACLQFAPQVGDIHNNLNRADAVLSKANPEDLDLLVLPELAFTGYNFRSLQHISPYLEPQGSGITALWARTIALKHNCVVSVGYPEKVDVKPKWPTSPEYYNSVITINGEGETVANYRKAHLYYTDETWALEGPEGFWEGYIPGLGHTSMGICMDLKFEAPWHAFEFAFHILEMESNLVIVHMAWLTREDARLFSRMPKEPDMDTLTYWITRLEPLIRAETDEEVIVVFCNRTGVEDDAVYAGTSAVIGIKAGEVSVYGMLGRGEKDLLVVDTDAPPFAKLVYRPDDDKESVMTSSEGVIYTPSTSTVPDQAEQSGNPPRSQSSSRGASQDNPAYQSPRTTGRAEATKNLAATASSTSRRPTTTFNGVTQNYDSIPLGRRSNAGSDRSNRSVDGSVSSQRSSKSKESKRSRSSSRSKTSGDSTGSKSSSSQKSPSKRSKLRSPPIQIPAKGKEFDTIPTPTAPSPTPLAIRPKLVIPKDAHKRPPVPLVPTPHPSAGAATGEAKVYGGRVTMQQQNDILTPTTAFDDMTPQSPKFFWVPSDALLRTPMESRKWTPASADSPTLYSRTPVASRAYVKDTTSVRTQPTGPQPAARPPSQPQNTPSASKLKSEIRGRDASESETPGEESRIARPSSPKSRNASRSRDQTRRESALDEQPDLAAIAQRLDALSPRPDSAAGKRDECFPPRPSSALAQRNRAQDQSPGDMPERPSSPKSRNASRNRPMNPVAVDDPVGDERQMNASRGSIRITASPSILDNPVFQRPSQLYRPDSRRSNIDAAFRPMSRAAHSRSSSVSFGYKMQTPMYPAAAGSGSQPRAFSRGRQPGPTDAPEISTTPSSSPRVDHGYHPGPTRRPSAPSFGFRSPDELDAEIRRISPDCPVHCVHRHPSVDPDDEIIAEIIIRRSPSCVVHSQGPGSRKTPEEDKGRSSTATSDQVKEKVSPQLSPEPDSAKPALPVPAAGSETTQPSANASLASPEIGAASVETLGSPNGPPATPQIQFDPRAPKAMVLMRDDDDAIPTTPLSAPFLKQMMIAKCIGQEAIGKVIARPKSAMW
ncbi:hypothetical protein DL769_004890 [Monosporascus sp. CRB-8-3]|nr:hypothetical protein DL769_004890 [Monosporascus sp. CRB-8-3]